MACDSRASSWLSASVNGAISSGMRLTASGDRALASRWRTPAAISCKGRRARPTATHTSQPISGSSNSKGATVRSAMRAATSLRADMGWAICTTPSPSCTL